MAKSSIVSRLLAAGGEVSVHSLIGQWRQKVGGGGQSSHPSQAGDQTFVQTQYSESGGQTVGSGSDIVFDEAGYGDIEYNPATGVFRLRPTTNYELTAYFTLGNFSGETVNVAIEWVDANTEQPLHARHGAFLTPVDNTNSINPQPVAATFHQTGGAVQEVKLMVTSASGTADVLTTYSYAMIKEVG